MSLQLAAVCLGKRQERLVLVIYVTVTIYWYPALWLSPLYLGLLPGLWSTPNQKPLLKRMRWPISRSNFPGQLPSGLTHDGKNEKPRRKRLAPNSGLTTLRSRCKACSMILSEGSKEHARTVSMKLNLLWKNSSRSSATSDACCRRPTCWEQREGLMMPRTVNTAQEWKNQQESVKTRSPNSDLRHQTHSRDPVFRESSVYPETTSDLRIFRSYPAFLS
jgi:hypothetical protein